jgi:hypothetical protein
MSMVESGTGILTDVGGGKSVRWIARADSSRPRLDSRFVILSIRQAIFFTLKHALAPSKV